MSDLISRAEAIDACCRGWNNTIEDCIRNIKEIPSAWYKGVECAQDIISAQPSAGTSSDLISRSDAICEVLVNDGIDNIVDRINALPSANVIEFDFNKYQTRVRNKVNDGTPSAEIPTESTNTPTNTPTDLISRADALRELNGACSNWKDDCKVAEIINALPSADAVEVVRCRNCYYAEDDITHMFCVYFGHKVYGDDYCSNAVERREDGGE